MLARLTFWRASSLIDTGTETHATLHFFYLLLFISNIISELILLQLFRISRISIISPLIVHLCRGNMSNCFNRSSYDNLLNV